MSRAPRVTNIAARKEDRFSPDNNNKNSRDALYDRHKARRGEREEEKGGDSEK